MTLREIDDPAHWRERAEEMLTLAFDALDPGVQRMLIRMAAGYEVMALRAEERLAQGAVKAARR